MQKAAFLSLASVAIISSCVVSCATKSDTNLQLATGTVASEQSSAATKLYAEAYSLDKAGKTNKATKRYGKVADYYPLSKEGSLARFRHAELLHQDGKLVDSFDSYQQFITRYHGTSQYKSALKHQEEVAHAAASGKITNNFVGLKSKIPRSKAQTMLEQVRDNAPHAATAPKAQFAIGHMWEQEKNLKKAIAAYEQIQVNYPRSAYAPQALHKVGSLLLELADKGNRNKGNLDTARNTFSDIVNLYPRSKQAPSARKMIKQIDNSDIQRSFDNAEFYQKKKQFTAAAFYYKEVIRKTKPGSTLHQLAKKRVAALTQ